MVNKVMVLLLVAVASTMLLASQALMASTPDGQYALAQTQNQTSTANQTSAGTAQNQTSTANQTSGPLGNLTSADFDPVEDNLAYAREQLQDNNIPEAYRALGWANNDLFTATNELEPEPFKPLLTQLQDAQDALLNKDMNKAFNGLGSAELELLKLNQQVPAAEE
jgi:hypothetical protein